MLKKLLGVVLVLLTVVYTTGCQNMGIETIIPKLTTDFKGSVILGQPTNSTMTVSILSDVDYDVYLTYGIDQNNLDQKTDVKATSNVSQIIFTLTNLSVNSEYYYSIMYKTPNESSYSQTDSYQFSMPKTSGNNFNFVIQSDSHLLNKADKDLYTQSMKNMHALNPDFMMDLGDTFLLDNGNTDLSTLTQTQVNEIYRQQLPYFDLVTRNAPLYYGLGNHESEYGPLLDGTKNNVAAMSTIARTTYLPNPTPNDFYTGNGVNDPLFGQVENYYAYNWGDALFVVIDPYRYGSNAASENIKTDGWGWSLGKDQYDWFKTTLESSNAKYKFVFSHHAIGNMRGGANIASLYEWGGHDQKGNYVFDQMRPGWGKPIQQVMKESNVTIFFQGHDHVFAREMVDGIVYQSLPKPAEKVADKQNNFASFTGDVLMNSGFLNINVSDKNVQVDYNRNYLVASGPQTTGIVYSYSVTPDHQVEVLKTTADDLTTYGLNDVSTTKPSGSGGQKGSSLADFVGVGANPTTSLMPVSDGFSFAIEADPHFDENSVDSYLNATASNIIKNNPAFLVDLGDTSMLEKLGKTPETATNRNQLVADYFAKFNGLDIKMVTGNHDVAINTQKGNYYSYTKGDAQIIVLDPYAYSRQTVTKGTGWATTLGDAQYAWLKQTLETSSSKYKFVFIHNLTGGLDTSGRGGAEAASFFEWGGKNLLGVDEFKQMRPNMEMPIHDLLVKYGVDVVFHGHDHFYGKQEKDGIIYQLVPQPGSPGNSVNDAHTYGYLNGVFLPSVGYLRVVVNNDASTIEYIKTNSDGNFEIADHYQIK